MRELDLYSFQPVVGRVSDHKAVVMTRERRRESPDGSGEEEGGDAVGLGKDCEFEVGRVVDNQIDLVKLISAFLSLT